MFQTFTETSDPAKHPPRLAALRKAMRQEMEQRYAAIR